MFTSIGSQDQSTGATITITQTGTGTQHQFILPGPNIPNATNNHALLFGTAGLQAAGGPAPDFIIPDGFLFANGGTISFSARTAAPTRHSPPQACLALTRAARIRSTHRRTSLAAEGRDVFRNFVVPVPLTSPRWIQSIELRPSNPRVAHHARLGVDSTNESARRDAEDPEPGYAGMAWGQDPDGHLVIWAPGMIAKPGSADVAWRLFPRSTVVLHTHLQPSGKPETVSFRIGIRFASEAPKVHPAMLRVGSTNIDIPAGAARHVVADAYTVPIDVDAHRVFPHAHSLCTEVKVIAERPDGPPRGSTSMPLR